MKVLAMVTLLLAGCAGANFRPLIDASGKDPGRLESDMRECQQYASQVAGAGTQAAVGAGAGALLGHLFAGLAGGNRMQRNQTSAVATASGALGGAAHGETDQRNVIRRCMAGRGYNVLN